MNERTSFPNFIPEPTVLVLGGGSVARQLQEIYCFVRTVLEIADPPRGKRFQESCAIFLNPGSGIMVPDTILRTLLLAKSGFDIPLLGPRVGQF